MARAINQVILMGRLTRDPELRTTSSGKSVGSFSIAVDRIGQSEETDFFDVTVWEKTAENVEAFLGKGSKVLVQGRLQLDRWEKDGEKSSKVTVVANDVTFLDSPSDEAKKNTEPMTSNQALEQAGYLHRKDTVLDDIDDKPIDLSEIPF